jgi:hypothetical protein
MVKSFIFRGMHIAVVTLPRGLGGIENPLERYLNPHPWQGLANF